MFIDVVDCRLDPAFSADSFDICPEYLIQRILSGNVMHFRCVVCLNSELLFD